MTLDVLQLSISQTRLCSLLLRIRPVFTWAISFLTGETHTQIVNMSPVTNELKTEALGSSGHVDVAHSKVLGDELTMNDAFEGENAEHNQTLWESVKTHPKACFWAFIMCFTIVRLARQVVALGGTY